MDSRYAAGRATCAGDRLVGVDDEGSGARPEIAHLLASRQPVPVSVPPVTGASVDERPAATPASSMPLD